MLLARRLHSGFRQIKKKTSFHLRLRVLQGRLKDVAQRTPEYITLV